MAVDHQPTFSRTSLNILIVACVGLILIFGQSSKESSEMNIPPAPKLNVSSWVSDSGAKVWFSPKLDDHISIQLDYLAGFAYNQPPFAKGSSYLLVSLLNHEAKLSRLPIHFELKADFIEASVQLSTEPLTMKQQLKAIQNLLYRPTLANKALQDAKLIIQKPFDSLWQQAFAGHDYAGPKQGTEQSLSGIHRASLQKFQQSYLHPQRLFVGISGNINQQAAQVIVETLLPVSKYPVKKSTPISSQPTSQLVNNDNGILVLEGSTTNAESLIQQRIGLCILKALPVQGMRFVDQQANNVVLIEHWSNVLDAMDTEVNSDMMRQAKRQCIKHAFAQTHNGQAVSRFLAWLNRYELPSHFLKMQFDALANWQEKDWLELKHAWFDPRQE